MNSARSTDYGPKLLRSQIQRAKNAQSTDDQPTEVASVKLQKATQHCSVASNKILGNGRAFFCLYSLVKSILHFNIQNAQQSIGVLGPKLEVQNRHLTFTSTIYYTGIHMTILEIESPPFE